MLNLSFDFWAAVIKMESELFTDIVIKHDNKKAASSNAAFPVNDT
jgi:hypothetical protein